jgi:hypothetical protein
MGRHYSVGASDIQVKHYSRADFLLVFANRQLADQVLHTPSPLDAEFHLILQRWRRQAGALFKPFWCKVLLVVSNIPTHDWSVDVVHDILGSSCLVFDSSPRLQSGVNLFSFLIVAWCSNPDFFIPI